MTEAMDSYVFTETILANDVSVRNALTNLRERLKNRGISNEGCGRVEIVLAEAMNNIVEHAYPRSEGKIEIKLRLNKAAISAEFQDTGRPMPGLSLPKGNLPDTQVDRDSLPEGGFGWFLIHTLTNTLDYSRFGNKNLLRMTIVLGSG